MESHQIKKDKFQYIVVHPVGCKQYPKMKSGFNYTYITPKGNLPWELHQCGVSPEEQSQLLASC